MCGGVCRMCTQDEVERLQDEVSGLKAQSKAPKAAKKAAGAGRSAAAAAVQPASEDVVLKLRKSIHKNIASQMVFKRSLIGGWVVPCWWT